MEKLYSRYFDYLVSRIKEHYNVDMIRPYEEELILPGLYCGRELRHFDLLKKPVVGRYYLYISIDCGDNINVQITKTFPLSIDIVDEYDSYSVNTPAERYDTMKGFYTKCLEILDNVKAS